MLELRWNPILKQWIIIATHRQNRTYKPPKDYCPLCPTKKGGLSTEVPAEDYDLVVGDIDMEDGYKRVKQMLEKDLYFTAIFAYNDMMVFGAAEVIKEKGLRISQDIGLVGYDDISFSSLISPQSYLHLCKNG